MKRPGGPTLSFPDLVIRSGERILLTGASGAGKTTLLSMLTGLLAPQEGAVLLDGQDFYTLGSGARDRLRGRRFGFVFQTLHLLPSLTLRQNIALAANMAGLPVDEARLDGLLATLGLAGKAARRPDALSQGEQQRAAIARAVLNRPAIIVADEPTSALDDANAGAVMQLLLDQAEETGAALLVATHDSRILSLGERHIHLLPAEENAA
ncbi:ABC transporter ATP-binding protein [Radicibacter daui]|uniref:ABC transporter ATP-binding protein n=1 Tax=Radicibacter daui TaxID=3064829 RepID=UPI004046EEC9